MTSTSSTVTWLLIFFLSVKFAIIQTSCEKVNELYEKFESDHLILESKDLENFHRVINFVADNQIFQSRAISIGFFYYHDILDHVIDYLQERIASHYLLDLRNFANGRDEHFQTSGLTWLIVVENVNEFDYHVNRTNKLWNPENKFFILFVGKKNTGSSIEDWMNIFTILWTRHRVYKIMIASMQENFRYIYTYSPFEKTKNNYGKIRRMDTKQILHYNIQYGITPNRIKHHDHRTNDTDKMFEDFENLNGYPVKITIFPSLMMKITTTVDKFNNSKISYTFIDGNVMTIIENMMNAKFIVNILKITNEIDEFEEALDTLRTNEQSEIIFTQYFTRFYNDDVEFTKSIFEDKLCLIAPSSKRVPKYLMPILPFSNKLWYFVLFYNFAITIVWILLQKVEYLFLGEAYKGTLINCNSKLTTNNSINDPPVIHSWIVNCCNLFILICYPLYGGKSSYGERAFLFGTLFFGLIVGGLYQSYLVSSLSKPIFYPELESMRDVAESNRTIVTKYQNLLENTFEAGSEVTDRLRSKMHFINSSEKTYDMVVKRGLVGLNRFSSFELENQLDYYDYDDDKLLVHLVSECPVTYAMSYVVKLFSPYRERIDALILWMHQAGLVDKWYRDMILPITLMVAKKTARIGDDHVKLSMQHLSLAFYGLIIGLVCCSAVFIWELHHAKKLKVVRHVDRITALSKRKINVLLRSVHRSTRRK